jgi:hypothetical protein
MISYMTELINLPRNFIINDKIKKNHFFIYYFKLVNVFLYSYLLYYILYIYESFISILFYISIIFY